MTEKESQTTNENQISDSNRTLDDPSTEGKSKPSSNELADGDLNATNVAGLAIDEHSTATEPVEETEVSVQEDSDPIEQSESAEAVAIADAPEKEKRSDRRKKSKGKKPRLRAIPIWLRLLLSILLIGASLILGLLFGYGALGGHEPGDVLKPQTWYHILDMIRGS